MDTYGSFFESGSYSIAGSEMSITVAVTVPS